MNGKNIRWEAFELKEYAPKKEGFCSIRIRDKEMRAGMGKAFSGKQFAIPCSIPFMLDSR
jgi:hypothetical protein